VPIAIAGSKLCAQAIFDDLSLPYPSTYDRSPKQATPSSLDIQQPLAWYYKLESIFSALVPYIIGAVLAVLSGGGWASYKGLTTPKMVYVQQGRAGLGNGTAAAVVDGLSGLDKTSPVVLAGALILLAVSVLYVKSQ
jgi:hypothetical protein